MNGVGITHRAESISVDDNIYEISDGLINFSTNQIITHEDIGDEDKERKTGPFLRDIRYISGVDDNRSKFFKTIKRLYQVRVNCYVGKGLAHPQSSWSEAQPDNRKIERLDLIIVKTNAGLDGLYDEILRISY